MLTLDEIGQSVRNNIQLVIDHVGLPLAVGPISDEDYKILCGGYGELEWDYMLGAYGNSDDKYEFCIKLVQQGVVQGIPSGAAICVYGVEDKIFRIHIVERFSREDESHPLKGRMVLLTLMSAFVFVRLSSVRLFKSLNQFLNCGHFMSRSVLYGKVWLRNVYSHR